MRDLRQKTVGEEATPHSSARMARLALLCTAAVLVPGVAAAETTGQTQPDTSSSATTSGSQANATDSANQAIVVTGVRAAILKALQTKRNAQSIVDSISAEDIGKLPDDNIAEAVQRIPGVAIDRQGGEGRYITINGFGPELSLTLFNGRQIASADSNRSFSFDTIASNLVSQVNVYKTANADVPEGGLGGTIDVRTARPFDFKGLNGSVQVSYDYDGNSKKGFPQFSAVWSDRFMDGRLGLLLSFTHQHRRNVAYNANVGGWNQNYFIDPVSHGYVADAKEDAWRAWNTQYRETTSDRTRNGGTAVLQFAATDNLTLTADYLYSKYTQKDETNGGGAYLWALVCAQQDTNGNCVQGTPGTTMDGNGFYTKLDMSGPVNGVSNYLGSFLFQHTTSTRPVTTQLGGLNAEWKPTSNFKGVFDTYWSSAINNNRGLNTLENLEFGQQPEYVVTYPANGAPQFDLLGNDLTAASNIQQHLGISQVYNTGTYVKAVNKGVRADFDWASEPGVHLRFGASYNDERKSDVFYATPSPVDQLYHATGLGQPFPTSVLSGVLQAGSQFGVSGTPFPVLLINADALRAWMADPTNLALRPQNGSYQKTLDAFIANGGFGAQRTASSFTIDEKDLGAYAELSKDFNIGSMPANFVAGVRYSQTNLASSGTSRIIIGYIPNAQNVRNLVAQYAPGGTLPVTVKHKYSYFLPSFNAKINLTPDVIFRLSATRTMSRPTLGDLAPAISCCGGTILRRSGSGQNPDLKPFTSNNFDASAEWYYSKRGALAIAGFYKDAQDFIVSLPGTEQITTITTVDPGILAVDPTMTLAKLQTSTITRPRNAASAKVEGIDFAWTHTLPFGLGFQANYTKVWSKTQVDPGLPTSATFAMPGISDTANAVVFYEKGPISARVAWNWRSAFLVSPGNNNPGDMARPIYGDNYYQIDARIGYNVGYGVELGVNVVNLTNRKVRYYAQSKQYLSDLYSYGRQFTFTASKKF